MTKGPKQHHEELHPLDQTGVASERTRRPGEPEDQDSEGPDEQAADERIRNIAPMASLTARRG